jgi:hypothetical protein
MATFKRRAIIGDRKPTFDAWYVSIDLSTWLGTETISNVVFSAKDLTDESDVTSTVLDAAKNTNTNTVVKPYIQAGSHGTKYRVTMKISTAEGSQGEFYLEFKVKNY